VRLYYVRHGQSENNRLWVAEGTNANRVPDPALTEIGVEQARHVARHLARCDDDAMEWDEVAQRWGGFAITHVYASLMARAVATGHAIAAAMELPLLAWPDVHELGGIYRRDPESGVYTVEAGAKPAELAVRFPGLVLPEDLPEQGWWGRDHEAWDEFMPRAERVVATLRERHGGTDDRVVMVSHGGFFAFLMCAILGLPAESRPWFSLSNGSVSRIDFDHEGRVWIRYINRREFLPVALAT